MLVQQPVAPGAGSMQQGIDERGVPPEWQIVRVPTTRSRLLTQVNPCLLLAEALALVFHGALLPYTFKRTFDAYVHIFFADHYVRSWFDPWDFRWYTGFTLTSYPPGSQQSIALLSRFVGLQNGFIIVQLAAILFVVLGVYRFSKLWVSEEAAGYAALLAVFSSSICETVHVFGQLPTIFSLGFLLNALPFVRRWLERGDWKMLLMAWLMNAATTAGHHVTTLFGAVFFVAPVIGAALVDQFRLALPDEPPEHPARVTRQNFRALVVRRVRRVLVPTLRAGIYMPGLGAALILVVLPYWLWSKNDPLTQVAIPHASRDSFIVNINAGIAFWIIPYGIALFALPYIFYKGYSGRTWPLALSFTGAFILGTGGTTPIPRFILRGAYDIVTLDRFTFWATILMLPLLGELVVSLRHRGLAQALRTQFGWFVWRATQIVPLVAVLVFAVMTINFTQFRKIEPAPIDTGPIVNFLEKDQHSRWRYLTLGFGDQMAWLSAQTTATSVDGNYHSARRLPEMTSTPVERLEGAKFRGIPGIGSLQQFLAVPDKYNLKFVFSNDQFYDPLLFFSGWHRLQRLENGIMVWEREDIPPLPEVLPRKDIPAWQKAWWGLVPMGALITALTMFSLSLWWPVVRWLRDILHFRFWPVDFGMRLFKKFGGPSAASRARPRPPSKIQNLKSKINKQLIRWSQLPPGTADDEPREQPWQVWRRWVRRVPRLRPATPLVRRVRTGVLIGVVILGSGGGVWKLATHHDDPVAVVLGYYDDIDFRRLGGAYARLDPVTRPTYEQYLLNLSVTNGLVASYGKLDSIKAAVVDQAPGQVTVRADLQWVTALNLYPTSQLLTLQQRGGSWYIEPQPTDVTVPPDEFFRRGAVVWHSQGRQTTTGSTDTTAAADVLDRPELQILSARLVKVGTRYSVVGEVINTDADPADVTVTASLFDGAGHTLTWYNAQGVIMHKLFPKEVTPFRVDFEGVAGAVLSDTVTAGDFKPDAYSPVVLTGTIAAFGVYAKGVVTGHDLYRDVQAQDVHLGLGTDGQAHLLGQLVNSGTLEATIPHLLITYYDAQNRVVWVDQAFLENAIRPQRAQPFDVRLTSPDALQMLLDKGDLFANNLQNEVNYAAAWGERIPLPPNLGYASIRLSVNYLVGVEQ